MPSRTKATQTGPQLGFEVRMLSKRGIIVHSLLMLMCCPLHYGDNKLNILRGKGETEAICKRGKQQRDSVNAILR